MIYNCYSHELTDRIANRVVIIMIMDEVTGTEKNRQFLPILILGGVVMVVLCGLCTIGGYYINESVMPAGAKTRTALVQLFATVTPIRSLTLIPSKTKAYPVLTIPAVTPKTPTKTPSPFASVTSTFVPPEWLDPPVGRIVYTCTMNEIHQICLMDASGEDQKQLTESRVVHRDPALVPDGNSIIFSSNQNGRFQIYEMSSSGENLVKVSTDTDNLYAPESSPNGNRIVFVRDSDEDHTIWVMKRDGSNSRPLLSEGMSGNNPTWAPDNNRIAFTSSKNGSNQIYVTNILGTNVRQVTKNISGINGGISWSSDGKWLVFSAGSDGDRDIYIIGVDGDDLQRLTDGGNNLDPYFSPDGRWITFSSTRDGENEIYVIRSDGVQETRLTGSESSNWQPHWSR